MYQNINFNDFCDSFRVMDRDNQFSYEGKRALFDYLEELEADTGEDIELDVVALCCDFTEYDSFEELQKEYNDIETIDDLRDETLVIEFNHGSLIVQAL